MKVIRKKAEFDMCEIQGQWYLVEKEMEGLVLGREMKRGFHPAGNVLFFDLGAGYTGYICLAIIQ